ncbi:MAG: hypothetical protein N4A76_17850 [Firmicutes bacterium]|jgi:type III secretion system FlhB-like substrate exporter|nr:hypothetical protein [Bacillota bacterium]
MMDLYSKYKEKEDFERYAKKLIEDSKESDIMVEDDPDCLKEILGLDLRDNVPPQMYKVISSIVHAISNMEEENNEDSKG